MIILLSNHRDRSTEMVARWLYRLEAPYLFLSDLDLRQATLDLPRERLYVKDVELDLCEPHTLWLRRPFSYHETGLHRYLEEQVDKSLALLLRQELSSFVEYLYLKLVSRAKYLLGNPEPYSTNKLCELEAALRVGFTIPETRVISSKAELLDFMAQNPMLIVKSVFNATTIYPKDKAFSMFTTRLKPEDLPKLPERFTPSLVQAEIEKAYELRVFYLDGRCYAMVICSQEYEATSVDFRHKQEVTPMRMESIALSEGIEKQIRHFMEMMNLKVGSLDFVQSVAGEFYFLEVNHAGQFDLLEKQCNYGIYKHIAEQLIAHHKA